jgi:hypothetical protein
MAGYGLDDSDFDEFLESSSEEESEAVLLEAPFAAAPAAPALQILLTSSAQQLPLAAACGDACVLVPPSRCPLDLQH